MGTGWKTLIAAGQALPIFTDAGQKGAVEDEVRGGDDQVRVVVAGLVGREVGCRRQLPPDQPAGDDEKRGC